MCLNNNIILLLLCNKQRRDENGMSEYFTEELLFIMVSAIWRSDFYFLHCEPNDSREPLYCGLWVLQ
jgi:hypothetical protein